MLFIATYHSFQRAFFPTEKDIAEDKHALKMLSIQKRGPKKSSSAKTRSLENSFDHSGSEYEDDKAFSKKEAGSKKRQRILQRRVILTRQTTHIKWLITKSTTRAREDTEPKDAPKEIRPAARAATFAPVCFVPIAAASASAEI